MARSQDTEITLGTSRIVVIFFGLVGLCAVFFAIGFKLGKASVVQAVAAPAASTVAPGGVRPSAARVNPAPPKDATAPSTPVVSDPGIPDGGTGYYVQVAAVSKEEDADSLVDALKKKDYPAMSTSSGDNLFHIQVGPFNDIKEAEAMRAKLVGDGYNPILKK
jgi:cell division septation protein DedD